MRYITTENISKYALKTAKIAKIFLKIVLIMNKSESLCYSDMEFYTWNP